MAIRLLVRAHRPGRRLRALFAAAILVLLGPPLAAQAPSPSRAANVMAAGVGLDAGLVGLKLAHRLRALPLDASLGVGLAGVAPGVSWRAVERGAWSALAGGAVLYSPLETPITSAGAAIAVGGLGVQHWPSRRWRLYFTTAAEPWVRLAGHTEGGGRAGLSVRVQVGITF